MIFQLCPLAARLKDNSQWLILSFARDNEILTQASKQA